MKVKLYSLCWIILFFFVQNSLKAQSDNPISAAIVSQEINSVSGSLAFKVRVYANDTIYNAFIGNSYPTGWNVTASTSVTKISPGQFADIDVTITYPVANLPFFPVSTSLEIDYWLAPSLPNTRPVTYTENTTGKVYFTPYNTVEVWNDDDFYNLNRIWYEKGTLTDTIRRSIPKESIPVSNILPTDSITEDWQDDFQSIQVAGLPYEVMLRGVDPAVIDSLNVDDGSDSTVSVPGAKLGFHTFSGTIKGRLVSNIVNNFGDHVQIGLAGILVKLKERDKLYNEQFAETMTDANGYYTLTYSRLQSPFEGKHIELFIKVKSKNKNYDIKAQHHVYVSSTYDEHTNIGSMGTSVNMTMPDIAINSEPFRLVHWATKAWDFFASQGISLYNGLHIKPHYSNTSFFMPDALGAVDADIVTTGMKLLGPTIFIQSDDGNYESTIRHEFGHFVMWSVQQKSYIVPYGLKGFKHRYFEENTSRLAWSEGWADAIEMILDAYYWSEDSEYGRSEDGHLYEQQSDQSTITNGILSEYHVAGAIYDLWDGPSKNVPSKLGSRWIGFRDTFENGSLMSGWSTPDDTELTMNEIINPIIAHGGISGKLTTIAEYFAALLTSDCSRSHNLGAVFSQDNVGYNGFSLNTDVIYTQKSVDYTGQIAGVSFNYTDTYNLNLYNGPRVYDFFTPLSSPLTDNLILNGDTRNVTTIRLNPTGSNSGTFYTCGATQVSVLTSNVVLGGTTSTARLEIRSGSVYRMRTGSSLTINNNSTLYIGCGAELIFEPGATITLVGSNSKIIIDGKLTVLPGATFSYPYTTQTPVITGASPLPLTGSTYSVNLLNADSYTWTAPSGWKINGQSNTLTVAGSGGSSVTILPAVCGLSGQICVAVTGCANSSGCKTISTAACLNDALNFDGSNDRVSIPEKNGRLNLGTGSFVIEAYIKSNASGSVRSLVSKRTFASGSSSDGFLFGTWSDGRPFIQMKGTPNILPPSGS
ncbi:MAG TPA: hypothetical protein VL443_10015, partial [Cyclobacteriaceae bacterium]|nr:hypothetical protein [Cyclobacteriaceae bacterium]